MSGKEATARIKIKTTDLDVLGENFEKTATGYIDFLLLNC